MYDLTKFTLRDMTECGAALRNLSVGAGSMEEVANKIVRYLYDYLIDRQTGEKSCALVRFYKTHPFGELDEALQRATHGSLVPTPIIALTAYAMQEEVQKSLDAGCTAHLTKPITKAVLLEAIQAYT